MMPDHEITMKMISEVVSVNIGTVKPILTEDLKLHKICAKSIPKILQQPEAVLYEMLLGYS